MYGDGGCAYWLGEPLTGLDADMAPFYGGKQLRELMHQQIHLEGVYNELILNYLPFVEHLPWAIEAIFVQPATSDSDLARAARVRQAFKREFGLPEARTPPLVMYNSSDDRGQPFSLVKRGDE